MTDAAAAAASSLLQQQPLEQQDRRHELLIQLHERIINNDISLMQRKWNQKRSRASSSTALVELPVTANTTTTAAAATATNDIVIEVDQPLLQLKPTSFLNRQVISLPPTIIRQKKLELYKRLQELRQYRIALTAKIKTSITKRSQQRKRKSRLSSHKSNIDWNDQRNSYITSSKQMDNTATAAITGNIPRKFQNALKYDSQYQKQIWDYVQQRRQIQCIEAAYRFMGMSITMISDDNNNNNNDHNSTNKMMKIQFDIDHHNTTSYECILDIVHLATITTEYNNTPEKYCMDDNNNNNNDGLHSKSTNTYTTTATPVLQQQQLLLRLVYHNLPSSIPLTTIFQNAIHQNNDNDNNNNNKNNTSTTGHQPHNCTTQKDNWNVNDDTKNITTSLMIPMGCSLSTLLFDRPPTVIDNNNVPKTTTTMTDQLQQQQQQTFIHQLQYITRQIYHSCHAYHVRNNILEYLQQLATGNNVNDTSSLPLSVKVVPYKIQQLRIIHVPQQRLIYKAIEFHIIHQLSSIDHIQITLHYTPDLCRIKAHQPISVNVTIISPSTAKMNDILTNNDTSRYRNKNSSVSSVLLHLEGTVSDIDDDNNERNDDDYTNHHYEFIESTIRSFRTLPIQNAIQTVTDAMTEY